MTVANSDQHNYGSPATGYKPEHGGYPQPKQEQIDEVPHDAG